MRSEIKPTENSSTYKLWFWLQQWYSYIVHLSALILYDFFNHKLSVMNITLNEFISTEYTLIQLSVNSKANYSGNTWHQKVDKIQDCVFLHVRGIHFYPSKPGVMEIAIVSSNI